MTLLGSLSAEIPGRPVQAQPAEEGEDEEEKDEEDEDEDEEEAWK